MGYPTNNQVLWHQYGQTFAWSILLNVSIIISCLKYKRISLLLHAIFGGVIMALTYSLVLIFLIPYGFNSTPTTILYYLHAVIGCALLGFIVIQCCSGLYAYLFMTEFNNKNSWFKKNSIMHKYLGYFLALLYKINIIWSWYGGKNQVFYFLIIWQLLSISVLMKIKLFSKTLEEVMIVKKLKSEQIWHINSLQNLKKQRKQFILFGNYIYQAGNVIKNHPGGSKIIQSTLGRQVDRFIYGMGTSQIYPQIGLHSHSENALQLAGRPIAKLIKPPIYNGFEGNQYIKVNLDFNEILSQKTQIYILGLKGVHNKIKFNGYTDIRQLGQYFSLNINQKMTRLYTCVNFLCHDNIKLMNKLLPQLCYNLKKRNHTQKLINFQLNDSKRDALIDKINPIQERQTYLPLMMKLYQKGKFTSYLKQKQFKNLSFKISQPKGQGLCLAQTQPGLIIIVAGGTGLFPFCDLIDLLYKAQLLKNDSIYKEQILSLNPILQNKPFGGFEFKILLAIHEFSDIHPITKIQLIELNKLEKIKLILKINTLEQGLKEFIQNQKIKITQQKFQLLLSKQIQQQFSRIWLCGPNIMINSIYNHAKQRQIDPQKILIL